MALEVEADFPEKLEFLFEPARYKVLHGGRGGAKSWGIARALLILGAQKPLRILCAREIQKSISESVHQLLRDQIQALQLGSLYEVLNTEIRGANGTQFLFAGLKHNVDNIKSKEGLDIVWVEEAQAVSKASWDTLIPTIRKDGSEIWISFNPMLESDETYQRFVVKPPTGAKVVKIGWQDNPWFPEVLRAEKDDLKERDIDAYLNVWEGECRQMLEGAVYANELRRTTEAKRITRVPYIPGHPVHTFWDLGWADKTAIWFAQAVGHEYRLIRYHEGSQKPIESYLQELQGFGYVYGTHHLPHDAKAKQLGTGRSIEELMRSVVDKVRIVPNIGVEAGINAARTLFDLCWFDEELCADGLSALRHYQYEPDPDKGTLKPKPLHNWASHGADAFRYAAVMLREDKKPVKKAPIARSPAGWMV